ncbi:hypothetical protein APS56_10950 [Pseudalgibacter alginicilyticus]|uniref:Uncharacterized protein n=1 Tax=Pseudalgibacter alginicilyticus TaxID=1736674 RepID=A0A0P0CMB0_9FLAO|nr:T9SS type B sorting domain-containing protein [Pseudalgibacter alginicilyticus]ALJ05611.1 hypothetical protein APS56_10950 [Pseudalgibacter alginicilyticus]
MNYKKYILFLFIPFISQFALSQNTSIPDNNFEQVLIDLGLDAAPINGSVPTANINSIINLDIPPNSGITDLTGIEGFTNLQRLDCRNNLINILNVSQLSNLQILWCSFNQLTTLDVTQNSHLLSLLCDNNKLTVLDVSQNTNLNILVCSSNEITSLDISNNNTMSRLECDNNKLTVLDISNNSNMSFLNCSNNQLTRLDTSHNVQLSYLNVAFNQLTKLDISKNFNLYNLNSSNNNLCGLNLKNGNNINFSSVDFSSNTNLDCVVVDNTTENHTTWNPTTFTNYVTLETDCTNFLTVDILDRVIVKDAYTLPNLISGNYYTESGGNGLLLHAGDTISTSQTLYIYAETNCNSNESNFEIIINNEHYFIPRFFTPNNDGTNDFWKVTDKTNTFKNIYIYNRYGKLLKFLYPNSNGWDGTFNGNLLTTDDYWYVITLSNGTPLKGHFTLKR